MAIESSYPSLLGGVSEQVFYARQPGQVETQVNMISDLVLGLRRRTGTLRAGKCLTLDLRDKWDKVFQYTVDLGRGAPTTYLVDVTDGSLHKVRIPVPGANNDISELIGTYPYLVAGRGADLRATVVGNTLYIANTAKKPVGNGALGRDPAKRGFFFVRTGAFGKKFELTITADGVPTTFTYETPDGTEVDHAGKATPEYIVGQLASQANTHYGSVLHVNVSGAYAYIGTTTATISVRSTSGSAYITTSRDNVVPNESDLPAVLPPNGDGYLIAVGDTTFKKYYKYNDSGTRWEEAGVYGSIENITNVPITVREDSAGVNTVSTDPWEGRRAGDNETNPNPEFLGVYGITGIGSYQGRLLILSGPHITMSASGRDKQTNFYRETVTSLTVDSPIQISSAAVSGTVFNYAVPFNSDLVLFAEGHQAVIPGRGGALTPQNASVVLTTSYEASLEAAPTTVGRSLFYTAPRSDRTYSAMEMFPSGSTESQYDSQDVTNHIPDYMDGRCRAIVSSSTNNICVFLSTMSTRQLVVHEYLWNAEEKVHASWHKWDFPYDIYSAWFERETLNLLIQRDDMPVPEVVQISLKTVAQPDRVGLYRPCLDYLEQYTVEDASTLDPYIQMRADSAVYGNANTMCVVANGERLGESIGVRRYDEDTHRLYIETVDNDPGLVLWVGFTYKSIFTPTPPVLRDKSEKYIGTNKNTLVRYLATVRYTTPFELHIADRGGVVSGDLYGPGVSYTSYDFGLDRAAVVELFKVPIPCRIEMETGRVTFTSTSVGDMNIIDLAYLIRANSRVRRL